MRTRREFLKAAALGGTALAATGPGPLATAAVTPAPRSSRAYKYRIAFGAWMNDMRCEPLPLENWPAPQLDDECVRSLLRIIELQARAGYNMFDVWGFFAT